MRTGASLHPSIKSLKFPSEIVLLGKLEIENFNKAVTEILSDEVFPIDTAEDFGQQRNKDQSVWPLESGISKNEIKTVEELKGHDFRHFKEALDSIKERFAKIS